MKKLQEEKERFGRELVEGATTEREQSPNDARSEAHEPGPRIRRSSTGNGSEGDEISDVESFVIALRDAKLARAVPDRKRIEFDKQSLPTEPEERDERRSEREAQQTLELEKFKLLLDAFQRNYYLF